MQWRFLDIGQVHRDLRDSVLFDEPANRLHVFQHSGDPNRLAISIENLFSRWRAVFRFESALFPNIKRDRVRASAPISYSGSHCKRPENHALQLLLRPIFH